MRLPIVAAGPKLNLLGALLEKDERGKSSTVVSRRVLERGDRALGHGDEGLDIRPRVARLRVVISAMPLVLQPGEDLGESRHIIGEAKVRSLEARVLGEAVVQSTVDLLPGWSAAVLACPDEAVCTLPREGMEDRIVGGAYRTSKIGLARAARVGLRQSSGRYEEIVA